MSKKGLSLIALFVILTAIPLTVFLSQQQQEIRQRAAETQLTTPSCISPVSGSTNNNPNNMTFTWGSVSGAQVYDFRLWNYSSNGWGDSDWQKESIIVNDLTSTSYNGTGGRVISNDFGFPINLTPGQNYRYRVSARNSGEIGPWADCNFKVAAPTTPPTASLSGPSSGIVGQTLTWTGAVTTSNPNPRGDIWITKSDRTEAPNCPGIVITASRDQTRWCRLAAQEGASFEGSYTPTQPGQYWVTVNGYIPDPRDTFLSDWFTAFPDTECTGNPFPNGFDSTQWSDCGANDQISLNVAAAPTPTYLAADVDHDGCVGIVDFNLWLRAYQTGTAQPGTSPDINNDGRVDLLDFNAWYKAMRSLAGTDRLCQ